MADDCPGSTTGARTSCAWAASSRATARTSCCRHCPRLCGRIRRARVMFGRSGPRTMLRSTSAWSRRRCKTTSRSWAWSPTRFAVTSTRPRTMVVIPARFGGTFSIIVLEALAAGVPVVSTPFVDERYRDDHWKPVYLTAGYSPGDIATTVSAVLGADHAGRVAFGRNVAADFDWSRIGRRIEGVYERVLARARPG